MKNKYFTYLMIISISLCAVHIIFSQYFSKETNKFAESITVEDEILNDEILNYEMKNIVRVESVLIDISDPSSLHSSTSASDSALELYGKENIIPIPIDASGLNIIPLNQ